MTESTENEEGLPETADEAVDYIKEEICRHHALRADVFDFMPEKEIEIFIDGMGYNFDMEYMLLFFRCFDEIDNDFFQTRYTERVRRNCLDVSKSFVISGLARLVDEDYSEEDLRHTLHYLKRAVDSIEDRISTLKERGQR